MPNPIVQTITYDGVTYDLQDNISGYTTNTGTVTSVQVQATSPVQSSSSSASSTTLNTTISLTDAYGDTKNPYGTKSANYILAGPISGNAAAPSFRELVSGDIPDLSSTYLSLTDGGTVTGQVNFEGDVSLDYFSSYHESGDGSYIISQGWNDEDGLSAGYYAGTFYGLQVVEDNVSLTGLRTPAQDDEAATKGYVDNAITALPEPMVFKGSLGTGGTITTLPTASSSNEGYVYKVITAGTYASQAAKVGDTFISDGSAWVLIPSGDEPSGTVTSVGIQNDTNGGLSVSGSPITSSGTITIGHSNVLTNAQTTQAVYPIKIDKNGHISAYGSAVTIPEVPANTGSATTGISIADHSTGTVTGVQSSTTSVTGVQSSTTSVRGVKTGTDSTTTASKVTLGTAISVPNPSASDVTVPIRADEDTSIPNVTAVGTASTWAFEDVTVPKVATSATTVPIKDTSSTTVPIKDTSATTVPIRADSDTTVPIKDATATSIPNVTAAGSGSFTQGAFSGGSLTMTINANDSKQLDIVFTAATHGSDSHSHTAPTIGTPISIYGVQSSTTSVRGVKTGTNSTVSVTGVQSSTTSVTGVQSSTTSVIGVQTGTGSTTTASHVTGGSNSTVPTLGSAITVRGVKTGTNSTTTASKVTMGTAISIPNVTAATDVTVPIRADADTTVPIKDASATTVPIKDTSSTTVVTGKTHSITDNGHTHSI